MKTGISHRELALCGLLGAAGLLLPVLFHLLQLGRVFMPMYLPLLTLAFFVRPLPAAVTAGLVPLLSGALSGMPPYYPPVAVWMAVELGLCAGLLAAILGRWPRANGWLALGLVLVVGRFVYLGLVYLTATVIELPPTLLAGASLLAGWPGVVLMLIVVPPLGRLARPERTAERKSA